MTLIETRVKRWGNSFGIVIPSEVINKEGIKEEQKIRVIVLKDGSKVLKETFGILRGKLKRSSQEIKDELRRDLYNG